MFFTFRHHWVYIYSGRNLPSHIWDGDKVSNDLCKTKTAKGGWGTLESQTFQSTPSVPDSTVQWQNELFSPRLYSPELFSPRPFSLELFSPRPFSPELFSPRLYSPMEKWTFQSQTFQSWTLQSKTFQSWTFQSQTFQSQTLQSQGQNELFSPRPKRQLF